MTLAVGTVLFVVCCVALVLGYPYYLAWLFRPSNHHKDEEEFSRVNSRETPETKVETAVDNRPRAPVISLSTRKKH